MSTKKPYHISEYDGFRPKLSKNSLGRFCFDVLMCGAEIYQLWPLGKVRGATVYPAINATEEQVEHLKTLGWHFRDPPTVNLN